MEPALDVALSCMRNPSLVEATRGWPLPDGMLTLLRLAAGDQSLADELAASRHRTSREVSDAAIFFVHQVLFDPGADSYRTLGVRPDAGDAQIKEHYRWLVRWQHPDRAKDVWDGVYADRVNLAWQDLRTPERRRAYDERAVRSPAHAQGPSPAESPRPASVRTWHPVDEVPMQVSARWSRFLPTVVFSTLALVGFGLVALVWSARPRGLPPEQASVSTSNAALDAADRSARMAVEAAAEAEAAKGFGDDAALAVVETPAPTSTDDQASSGSTLPAASPAFSAPASDFGSSAVSSSLSAAGGAIPNGDTGGDAPGDAYVDGTAATTPARAQTFDPPATPAPPIERSAGRVEPSHSVVAAGAPESEAPVSSAGIATAEPIDRLAAEGMLHRLSRAYVAGDLPALLQLFSADARNNRGGLDAIADDYRKLFADSSQRELSLEPSGWMERGEEATLLARYRARVKSDGDLWGDRSDGWIRFELRRENGQLKISRMLHERDS